MNYSLNRLILEDRARARLNEYYYRHRAESLTKLDIYARVTVALGSGAAFTSSLTGLIHDPRFFQVLTALTALAAIVPPQLRLVEQSKKWQELASEWTTLAGSLAILDASSDPDDMRAAKRIQLLDVMKGLQAKDTTKTKVFLRWRIQRQVIGEMRNAFATTY